MEIRKEKKDSALSMAIEGRIDTTTAPQLETELKTSRATRAWQGPTVHGTSER